MASSFLSSILSKTSQVLDSVHRWAVSPSSSSDPRSSVLKDLKKLERTLQRIQAVIHDAEEREIREAAVKLWVRELKEVAYDAEDVLDEYHYEELRAQVEGRASLKRKRVEGDDEEEVSASLSTIVVSIPDGMGDRIREIRERFDEISEDRERLRLREEDGQRRALQAPNYPPPTSHMVDESSIYGRVDDKEVVIDLLFSEGMGQGISVIPIAGKGGLGKTTIAQLVYNDSKVKEYFDLAGWVCVSDDFNVPRLTKEVIESLKGKSCDLTQLSTLQDTLKGEVKGKKVLLVLDDVWNEQQSRWESLKIPFVEAETAIIIMTCRNDSVAQIMQTVPSYHPDCLSPEQSWSLFRHHAFGDRDPEEQPRLADIGEQIVKKCSGLPLAVKTIGSLLRHDMDEDSWTVVLESDLWELDKNNETLASLRLSYSRMPAHLKPCFVYCSMFPKDFVFHKDDLVRLWMAQGYIPSGGRRRMEDFGREYFNDLQRRSFFHSFGLEFKMHDMLHELAKSIAGNECYRIMDKKIQNYDILRTLLPHDRYKRPKVIQEMTHFLLLPRCLRVLEFSWKRKDEIPNLIGNLKHLRYLHIQAMYIKKLPESVCHLYHLQTLIVQCFRLVELPNDIENLTNLRYLDIPCTMPVGIRKLTNLHTLYTHETMCDTIGALKQLNLRALQLVNVRALCISGLRNVVNMKDIKYADLRQKHELQSLFLLWNAITHKDIQQKWFDNKDKSLSYLVTFPEENPDVPTDEEREEAMLKYLQPHTNLKMLVINGYGGFKFPKWVVNFFSYASLQKIYIIDCEKIRYLHLLGKWDASMSKSMLEMVCISGCRQLISIAGLHNLHSLKNLKIYRCPQLQLLSEEGLPSGLWNLHIEECQQLASLPRMPSFRIKLTIRNCPKLQIMAKDHLSFMPYDVKIVDCPGSSNWYQIQKISCIQVVSGNKLTISNKWRKIMQAFNDLTSTGHGCELTIWNGPHIPLRLSQSTSLHSLVIKDCLRVLRLPDELLPSTLKSLVVDGCEKLRSLQLARVNRDALEELQIVNCPKLVTVEGLNRLFFPKFLRIKECPRLLLSKEDLQPFIPPCQN